MPVAPAGMDWVMWAVPAVLGLLGLWLLVVGLQRLFTGKLFGGGARALGGAFFLAAGAAVGLLALNILTYTRLSAEQDMATVAIRTADGADPQAFVASVKTPDGKVRDFPIQGDRWRLEARVVKWQPWANVIGFDAQGRLERIAGDYQAVADVNAKTGTAHDLSDRPLGVDMVEIVKGASFLPVFDTVFGSGVYMPMTNGAEYKVTLSQSGLVARPANDVAIQATQNWK